MPLKLKASGLTDVGRKRAHNEDAIALDAQANLYVIADGMGGHAAGEVASGIAVDVISRYIESTQGDHDLTWPFSYDKKYNYDSNRLVTAIQLANNRVISAIRDNSQLKGMGTTVVASLFSDNTASIAHVGDSRAYLLRNGRIIRLTEDHSWVNEQILSGYLSEEEAKIHPLKNVVTRALGGDRNTLVDVSEVRPEPGDLFLLCSDGLTTMLTDDDILEIVDPSGDLDENCHRLVDDSNLRGGLDNVTVILFRVESDGDSDSTRETMEIRPLTAGPPVAPLTPVTPVAVAPLTPATPVTPAVNEEKDDSSRTLPGPPEFDPSDPRGA